MRAQYLIGTCPQFGLGREDGFSPSEHAITTISPELLKASFKPARLKVSYAL